MTTPVEAPPAHRAGADAHPTHRPALDGIRMVAVVSVLLYHGLVGWSRGGFLGVDVFFVLSGYLITTLLVDEWQRWGSIDLVAFYRRNLTILPAPQGVSRWAVITTGGDGHTCGIQADGSLWCWGDNRDGQLGFDGAATKSSPARVSQ